MKPRTDLAIETLREWLSYAPETGALTWRKDMPGRFGRIGKRAGYVRKDGYREIMLKGQSLLEHRIAWALTRDRWPETDIDHIDGGRANNAIANLREATRAENCRNSSRKGFHKRKDTGHYTSKICVGGNQIHLGVFTTEDDAKAAYLTATEKYFGEFSVIHRAGNIRQ